MAGAAFKKIICSSGQINCHKKELPLLIMQPPLQSLQNFPIKWELVSPDIRSKWTSIITGSESNLLKERRNERPHKKQNSTDSESRSQDPKKHREVQMTRHFIKEALRPKQRRGSPDAGPPVRDPHPC